MTDCPAVHDEPGRQSATRLREQLEHLEHEQLALEADAAVTVGHGDIADRTHDVVTLIRLAEITERTAVVREQLSEYDRPHPSGVIAVGSTARLRFSDGSVEDVVIGIVEVTDTGQVTPTSPLGAALSGRRTGDEVDYRLPSGQHVHVSVIAVRP